MQNIHSEMCMWYDAFQLFTMAQYWIISLLLSNFQWINDWMMQIFCFIVCFCYTKPSGDFHCMEEFLHNLRVVISWIWPVCDHHENSLSYNLATDFGTLAVCPMKKSNNSLPHIPCTWVGCFSVISVLEWNNGSEKTLFI